MKVALFIEIKKIYGSTAFAIEQDIEFCAACGA
jgi:hypothetical protein